MRTVSILEATDRLLPDDWIRPLNFRQDWDWMCEGISSERSYGGGPGDHLRWIPVWLSLGEGWWGGPVGDHEKQMAAYGRSEFMRGDPPANSIMNIKRWWNRHPMYWTAHQKEWNELREQKVGFGKHRYQTLGWLQEVHPEYLEWAAAVTEIQPVKRLFEIGNLNLYRVYSHPQKWSLTARKPRTLPWKKKKVPAAGVEPANASF